MKTVHCSDFIRDKVFAKLSKPTAITLGNFDGCHLAHKEILSRTVERAHRKGLTPIALSFSPNPREYFSQESESHRLFTLEQKLETFEALGIELAIIQTFDGNFSETTHEEFYQLGLLETLKAKIIITGENFYFGKGRKGSALWLKERCPLDFIDYEVIPKKKIGHETLSSTRIRELLKEGSVEKAETLLGHPYAIRGKIQEGRKLGRTLGFPTANFSSPKQLLPKPGVYFGYFQRFSKEHVFPMSRALVNLGIRPSVSESNKELLLEAHCLDHTEHYQNLYGEICTFFFSQRLRDEKKFSSLEELKAQIEQDRQRALTL